MTALDRFLPVPDLVELDHVDLALTPAEAWALLRHGDLARGSSLVRALFALRTLPSRIAGTVEALSLRLDDLRSTADQPGFRVLAEDPPHQLTVGAVGKVWKLDIPFIHMETPDAFAAFDEPGYVKVAWALRVLPLGERDTRVEIEVRVAATDQDAWRSFRRYFSVVGPASRLIRRSVLAGLAKEHGTPAAKERERPLPGDELLPDAAGQLTHGITIVATPAEIFPWLVQMGGRRAPRRRDRTRSGTSPGPSSSSRSTPTRPACTCGREAHSRRAAGCTRRGSGPSMRSWRLRSSAT